MSSSNVEKIKERLSIVDVVSSYISLVQNGANYKAKCPFHNEKTPSFFVSSDRGSYYCFGCGAKGDIFSFVEHFEGTDFLGALKLLAERAGVPLEHNFTKGSKNNKDILYQIIEEATLYFENIFNQEKKPLKYLIDRGLKKETIKLFRIGYAPELWQSVSTYLINKEYKKEDLEKVGLIKIKDDGSFYDRFRGRIIFPINDSSGRAIAFSGRIFPLEDKIETLDKSNAKYLNSPETILFNKSNTLFGIDKAKLSIKKRDYTIIVEGQLDLILSHQAGFTNTVAVSGTALSDRVEEKYEDKKNSTEVLNNNDEIKINNLGLVRRLSSNVIFAYDGDSAGIRAAGRSALIALSLDMQVKIAKMKEEKDPADIISSDINKWKDIIKKSVDVISFYLDRIRNSTDDLRLQGKKIREIIFPYLLVIKSSIEKSTYINMIHKKIGLFENDILKDFKEYEKLKDLSKDYVDQIDKIEKKSRKERLEERLFGVIFLQDDLNKKGNDNFKKEIDEICKSFENKIGKGDFEKIKKKYESMSSVLAFEAEIWYSDKKEKIVDDFKEIVLNLEEEILKDKLLYLNTEIYKKENIKSEEEVNLLLKDYQKIVERIEKIKNDRIK